MTQNDVVVIGLGYIGLPTSALIAKNKINVLGVDINQEIVNSINQGHTHIVEPDLAKVVKKVVEKGFLKASICPELADIYLIVVPTPFKSNHQPDISLVEDAITKISPILKSNDLVIIESTSPVGTTEKMRDLIFLNRPDLIENIYIAYCPERVLPGNIMFELINNDRVIGGINEKSTKKACEFYSKFVLGSLYKTDSRTAEMCKLVENSSRDVQIAFANELSMVCEEAGIDVWKLIELANKHPRVNILSPGCGVGGHCIAVDPYFIISEFGKQSKLIAQARNVNNHKSEWCFNFILKTIENYVIRNIRKPKISILGLTFKPNVDDVRESPAMKIAIDLNKLGIYEIFFIEPNLKNEKNLKLSNLKESIQESDIIVFLVAHNEFKNLIIPESKIIIDFCGIRKN